VSESSAVSVVNHGAIRMLRRMGWLTTSQLPQQFHSVPAASTNSLHHSQGSSKRYQSRHLAKKSGRGVNHSRPVVKARFKRRLTRPVYDLARRYLASQARRASLRAPRTTPSRQIERPLGGASRVAGMSRTAEEVVEDGRTVMKHFWPSVRLGDCILKVRRRAIQRSTTSHPLMSL
jgi:hypothetical protein